jgi:hypothetical protein
LLLLDRLDLWLLLHRLVLLLRFVLWLRLDQWLRLVLLVR